MQDAQNPPWTPQRSELWRRIDAHPFDLDHPLSFKRRLARDRAWPLAFAHEAISEYRRFSFLAVTGPSPVTPSEQVDEVWHLHLTYSRDYWEVWCPDVLQAKLHHDPTLGGPVEQCRFRLQYATTLSVYETFFGPPPAAIWPATHDRFRIRPRYRVLDTDRWVCLPRPGGWLRRPSGPL